MSPLLESLTARAFRVAQPSEANVAIAEVRQALSSRFGRVFSYELFLPRANVDEYFLQSALPKLVSFLDGRGLKGAAPGVFVSLFTGDGLYFIEADAVLGLLAEAKQVPVSELFRRYRDGGTGEPKRLGG